MRLMMRFACRLACALLLLGVCAVVAFPATFTVTNTNDTGAGSLRQAIIDANTAGGGNTITFAIGSGAQTIQPLSALPMITAQVLIDGTTQPGYANAPLIVLSGSAAGSDLNTNGLLISASNCHIRGLTINGFPGTGIEITTGGGNLIEGNYIGTDASGTKAAGNKLAGIMIFASSNNVIGGTTTASRNLISANSNGGVALLTGGSVTANNTIQGNYIGTDVTGTVALPNFTNTGGAITIVGTNNLIGGTSAGAGNVISGNLSPGIQISGSGTTGNIVQGNFIGTDATGQKALGNHSVGISIVASAQNNTIGGTSAGAGNVISGNQFDGISIYCTGCSTPTNILVQGNFIGVSADGAAALPNGFNGISIGSTGNTVGGPTAAARNIISGNGSNGIEIDGDNANGNAVQGNYIGTNAAGSAAVPNQGHGIYLGHTGSVAPALNNTIGGTQPGAGNVISGNRFNGIQIEGFYGTNSVVQGNFIGTDATGTFAIPNTDGVHIENGRLNTIGGALPGARNVISGNRFSPYTGGSGSGVAIAGFGFSTTSQSNVVQGNYIGTNAAGTGPLPNSWSGVGIANAAGNVIGGNLIAYNVGPGVNIAGPAAVNDTVRANAIHDNSRLGIDLDNDGVSLNDQQDTDSGANGLQNYPVLLTVTPSNGTTGIAGTLNSTPNANFTLEFFVSSQCDASGYGEGASPLGTFNVRTDASGNVNFSTSLAGELAAGQAVTATATDAAGNTSEFSACNLVGSPGTFQFSLPEYRLFENNGHATITVTRTLGTTTTATVTYTTTDGTATAGQDYTAVTGTLTFAAGETAKTFSVPIINDTLYENSETVNLTLSAPSDGTTLGPQANAVLDIDNDDPAPTITTNNVSVNEESSNGQSFARFNVSLSAPSGLPACVAYYTTSGSATYGVDFAPTAGTLTFAPGETTKTISVPIIGDTLHEGNENFFVYLYNAINADAQTNPAMGTIIDNDPDPNARGELLISEFRPAGPAGANDEFVELYNNTDADIDLHNFTLKAYLETGPNELDFAAWPGAPVILPARAHLLIVNSDAYSLNNYAPGDLLVTGSDFFAAGHGLELVNNNSGTQVDAVGFSSDPADYREGLGLTAPSFNGPAPEYSYLRKQTAGVPQDTDDNITDFVFVATDPSAAGNGAILGAPGPENLASPRQRNATIKASLIDTCGGGQTCQNRVRSLAPDPNEPANSALGTLKIRRRFTNSTGQPVTALRFRVVDITTQPAPAGTADLRVLNSSTGPVVLSTGQTVQVQGLTRIEPPTQTANGGGLNTTLAAGIISLNTPLAAGAAINVEFNLGVMQGGLFRFLVNVEALTGTINSSAPASAKAGVTLKLSPAQQRK